MTLRLLPDAERLLSAFVRAQAEVTALVSDRVYTMLPATKEFPLVRLQRVGGTTDATPNDDALLRDAAVLQVEAYGGPKSVAWQLADTLRACIAQRITGTHPTGYVERWEIGSTRYLPDDTFDPAKPRVIFDVTLYLRPTSDAPTP